MTSVFFMFFAVNASFREKVFAETYDHGEPVILDLTDGDIATCDGRELSAEDVFDKDTAERLGDLDTQKERKEWARRLGEDERYVVSDAEDGCLKVAFPFAYKKILVFADEGTLTGSFGAEKVSYFKAAGEYIFDYRTEKEASRAYDDLKARFGKDCVLPDLPIQDAASEGVAYTSTEALSYSWGVDMMGLDAARDQANQDQEAAGTVKVAVLDSGILEDHELFKNRIAEGAESFVDGSPYSSDGSGHGTHVAGIIADGTSDHVKILPVKVLDEEGHGGFAGILNGIYYAIDQKAQVMNMSLAINLNDYGNYWSDTAVLQEERALEQAEEQGIICVAAAGNDSLNLNVLKVFPAISEHTLAISSITSGKERASSSNYGESVDYTAPGDQILSADAGNPAGYCVKSGTSMAAPHFSAACAMTRLYNPDLDKEALIRLLDSQVVDLGAEGKDKKFGKGLVVFSEGKIPFAPAASDEPDEPDEPGKPADPVVTVIPINIRKATVTMASASTYTGKPIRLKLKVAIGNKALKAGTDYTAAWSSNTNVGKAKVTITGKGSYTGKLAKTFSIRPKGTKITKIKIIREGKKTKGKKRAVTVQWGRQAARMKKDRVTGYQIQSGTTSSFKKGIKTKTIKGFKKRSFRLSGLIAGKRYYMRIRTYMKTGGKTYYAAWSKSKSVRVK